MAKQTRLLGLALPVILAVGCIDVKLPEEVTLLPIGTPFVVTGTATLLDNDGPCLAWVGENGVTYHLFQNARIENEVFDRIVRPGVTSRIEIATRTDIPLACAVGQIVEVQRVLGIVE